MVTWNVFVCLFVCFFVFVFFNASVGLIKRENYGFPPVLSTLFILKWEKNKAPSWEKVTDAGTITIEDTSLVEY